MKDEKKPENPSAFTTEKWYETETAFHKGGIQGGMTLRDYFAAKAMQALVTSCEPGLIVKVSKFAQEIAEESYKMADAILAEREK